MKDCKWITHEASSQTGMKLYYFKKSFDLNAVRNATVEISAQARYKLFINGEFVCVGPCKGTREKVFFDTVSVTDYLRVGENEIFVEVLQLPETDVESLWGTSDGVIRVGSALLVMELTCGDVSVKTDKTWLAAEIDGIKLMTSGDTNSATPIEEVCVPAVKNAIYSFATERCGVSNGEADHYWWGGTNRLFLHERPIPMLDFADKTDIISFDGEFFEAEYLTFGFPRFKLSGKGTVTFKFFECFDSGHWKTSKDRCDRSLPYYEHMKDSVTLDGEFTYEPFYFRCFRFIKVEISGGVSVKLDKFTEVNYPMTVRDDYDFGTDVDNKLWEMSVRTLQRCMHETYEDCPFYEQLQYCMDSSTQMLFNYQLTDDDRLARKCMDDFAQAQLADGLMPSRTPSTPDQHIPSFQLYFIFMVYAHYIRFGDASLVRKHLRAIDGVIEWFRHHIGDDGLVMQSKYWNFIDWSKPWVYDEERGCEGGVPLGVYEGVIGIYNPMLAYFLKCAAKLNTICGRRDVANEYTSLAKSLIKKANEVFWDSKCGMYADDVNHIYFSQHMQTWCTLSGTASLSRAKKIMTNSLNIEAKSTFAFAYFYFRALEVAGMYEKSAEMMELYRGLIKLNCTTIPETPTESRSECHAWGALAIYEFSATVLGVRTYDVLKKSVAIKPYINDRSYARGTVSSIAGNITVEWKKAEDVFEISISSENENEKILTLPSGETVSFTDKQKSFSCKI